MYSGFWNVSLLSLGLFTLSRSLVIFAQAIIAEVKKRKQWTDESIAVADKMSGRKRSTLSRCNSSSSSDSTSTVASGFEAKRQVTIATFEIWQRQNDEELHGRLRYDKDHADIILVVLYSTVKFV